jgi:hypothetical protein
LRPQQDRPVIAIGRDVVERCLDHGSSATHIFVQRNMAIAVSSPGLLG